MFITGKKSMKFADLFALNKYFPIVKIQIKCHHH